MASPAERDNGDDDDFREAVADVQPLRGRRRALLKPPAAAPVPRQRLRDEAAALAESLAPFEPEDALETGEALSYLREGMSRETLRKLRRGHWAVEDGIDLHGLTRVQAAAVLTDFLRRCLARRLRCVRIVHGKGLGILKAKLGRWLPQREEVLAYCQAPANDGGGGAVLVLLRARKG
jgi:DNA-nicking Smr family endonuclease